MEINIYVSSLGAYNNGVLTGQWTKLPVDNVKEDIIDKIEGAVGDEYFISDYEAPFKIHECDDLDELNDLANALEEDGIEDLEDLYHYVVDNITSDPYIIVYPFNSEDDVDNLLNGMKPSAIISCIGDPFNWKDDYLYWDGYGNLCTMSKQQFQDMLVDCANDLLQSYCSEYKQKERI